MKTKNTETKEDRLARYNRELGLLVAKCEAIRWARILERIGEPFPLIEECLEAGDDARELELSARQWVMDYIGETRFLSGKGKASPESSQYNRDLALRCMNGQVGSGMAFRG